MTPEWRTYLPGGIPALVGPTGSGKSALAESLAHSDSRWQLINADPFQAYRKLEIGTAKPEPERRALYTLMDCAEPDQALDAMQYAGMLREAIYTALRAGRLPLVVGGSGFYLDALEHPHDPEPSIAGPELAELRERIAADSGAVLLQVQARRPSLTLPSPRDHYRVEKVWIRAFGTPDAGSPKPQAIRLRYYGLWAEGPDYERILHARLHTMLDAGWTAEAQTLARQYGLHAPALRAIGYRQLAVDTPATHPTTVRHLITATRQYAKRQRTWFRSRPVRWFPAAPTRASLGYKGAQNLALRLIQYTDVCYTAPR